ncbi:hypothetical protein [Paenibacillus tepidiphilus]|uniref:hypothetical protein n=1 Tax=Paenibacillus tepidiphilus TaxID=2608683 RepID=UPI001238C1EB|nr:hypothetical protein [Paenibacillus tepidiphilus]
MERVYRSKIVAEADGRRKVEGSRSRISIAAVFFMKLECCSSRWLVKQEGCESWKIVFILTRDEFI